MRTELDWRKGYVSYGLGADISLPSCQIGGRLVSETYLAHSISDPRAEISGILVMVRRSSSASRGTTYWFLLFALWQSLCLLEITCPFWETKFNKVIIGFARAVMLLASQNQQRDELNIRVSNTFCPVSVICPLIYHDINCSLVILISQM